MNVGPIADLPDWTEDQLRDRFHELQARGLRGQLYDKKAVDQLLVDLFGVFQGKDKAIDRANRRAEVAESRQAEAEAAADGAIDQLHAFEAESPERVLMPHQAQTTLERAQQEADERVKDAEAYAANLIGDAEVAAEQILAGAAASVRAIGHHIEPDGKDPLALADWLDGAREYLAEREEQIIGTLSAEIEKLEKARDRVRKSDSFLNPEETSGS